MNRVPPGRSLGPGPGGTYGTTTQRNGATVNEGVVVDNDSGLVDPQDSRPCGDPCADCGHVFDQHLLVAFSPEEFAGVVKCPEPGCSCLNLWVLEGEAEEVKAFFSAQFKDLYPGVPPVEAEIRRRLAEGG